tara:strand:+ start:165 stop:560 length:396 start_codon:yes stop_codon:yes gene_type:complete
MANGTIAFDTLQTSGQIDGTARSIDTDYLLNGSAKAWFHIVSGGASTIALGDSFNATSISDGGTGIYNFNINNDMANAVYSLTVSSQAGAGFPDKPQINSQAAGSFQCRQAHASDEVDSGIYNATLHGELA